MAEDARRTVIISGNCHGRFLRSSLTRVIGADYDVVWARHMGARGQDVAAEEALRRCAFVLEQTGHFTSDLIGKALLPPDCRVIRFPIVWMNSLWPLNCVDPRNQPRGPDDRGPFPYGDRLLMQYLEEGASPEEAVERWFDADLGTWKKLDRYHEINVSKVRQLDLESDVPLGAFVLDNFRRRRLFVTYNHPSPLMLLHMATALCEALGYPDAKPTLPKGNKDGMGQLHVPLHPKIAAHFELEWFDPDMLYVYFDEQLTAREYMHRYAAFAPMPEPAAEAG
jgi:hypothetical protein